MEIECFLWIGHLWKEVMSIFPGLNGHNVKALPGEIIFEILSRLPADEVVKCRRVSKEWRALVPTPYFSQYHLTRASPIVLIHSILPQELSSYDGKLEFYFLDLGAKKNQMVKKYFNKPSFPVRKYFYRMFFSCNGLIVFETEYWRANYPNFSIYNPITQQDITLKKPFGTGFLCGIYFHTLTREYRLIYTYKTCNANCWHYVILAGGEWVKLQNDSFAPPLRNGPVNINGFVYWMIWKKLINYRAAFPLLCSASIITFDTKTEEIRVMAHPGKRCHSCCDEQRDMQLFNVENRLVYARVYSELIKIWVLEDSTKWLWAERYNINLDLTVKKFIPRQGLPCRLRNLIYIPDGQLVIFWENVGLFLYHLELKTFRKLDVKIGGYDLLFSVGAYFSLMSYTKSFEFWSKNV
ncbi:F-box protein At5g65850-like [Mercurialis annua]|uniref:F-box protein At5g65850-like n=1 Tax=Mercurialis annua TaxID=3986 RepID=UPI00215F9FD6|nr:F-box protein At5g65850-like [Mercurialis annua]